MREKQLQRMLRVMRATGDKAFVMDMESDDVFMLMNLNHYEDMISVQDNPKDFDDDSLHDYVLDDLIDAQEKEPKVEVMPQIPPETKEEQAVGGKIKIDTEPHLEPLPEIKENTVVRQENEENLADVPNDGEEEKFYLEPVE